MLAAATYIRQQLCILGRHWMQVTGATASAQVHQSISELQTRIRIGWKRISISAVT